MGQVLRQSLFVFFLILEGFIAADLLFKYTVKKSSDKAISTAFHRLTEPLLRPARFIISYSSFKNLFFDMSPFVTISVLFYFQKLLLM